VERVEAEAIYAAGSEAVVEVLLAMDRRVQQLEARVEKLERELAKEPMRILSRHSQRAVPTIPQTDQALLTARARTTLRDHIERLVTANGIA
jgi:hypothetical protein